MSTNSLKFHAFDARVEENCAPNMEDFVIAENSQPKRSNR